MRKLWQTSKVKTRLGDQVDEIMKSHTQKGGTLNVQMCVQGGRESKVGRELHTF